MNTRQQRKVPSATVQMAEQAPAGQSLAKTEPMVTRLPDAPAQPVIPKKIAMAILAISKEIGRVQKRGENTFHGYKYPKWEDVLEVLGPKITEHGLFFIQHEVGRSGLQGGDLLAITYRFTVVNEDGDTLPVDLEQTAVCALKNNKGVVDDKAASKCHTQGQKYFLMGLFKVRTSDMAEADHDATPGNTEKAKRVVPSSSGKLPPHEVQILKSDTAVSWADRFIQFIIKAETLAELEQWDKLNSDAIDRMEARIDNTELKDAQRADATEGYNKVVAALNRRQADFAAKPAQITNDKHGRHPDPTEQKPTITDEERDWLAGLGGAFSGCEDMDGLDEEAKRLMDPHQDKVSPEAWAQADLLYAEHHDRITA